MALTPQKRQKMEKVIYDTFSALDKTGTNTKHYKEMFSQMSDLQFDKFFKELFSDPSLYLILNVCDYEIDLRIDDIEDAAARDEEKREGAKWSSFNTAYSSDDRETPKTAPAPTDDDMGAFADL